MAFENLVLAGGGANGLAYVGVAKALQERSMLKNILRFAGNNTGSIVAAMLCVGFDLDEVEKSMPKTMELLYRDSWRIFRIPESKEWNPSDKFMNHIGDVLALKTKKSSITFDKIPPDYQGKELCITATTEGAKEEKIYDSKTNEKTEIREAIRKSIYIPAKLQPNKKKFQYGDERFLCNYPIDYFRGKTLGCLTYSEDTLRDQKQNDIQKDATLSSSQKIEKEYMDCLKDQDTFFNIFRIEISNDKTELSFEEFKQTFEEIPIQENVGQKNEKYRARRYAEMMYGLDVNAKMIFDDMKTNDKVTKDALLEFRKNKSNLIEQGYAAFKAQQKNVEEMHMFNFAKMNTFLKGFEGKCDARTICINTEHICASDFSIGECDIQFLIKQGKDSTETFFEKHKKI